MLKNISPAIDGFKKNIHNFKENKEITVSRVTATTLCIIIVGTLLCLILMPMTTESFKSPKPVDQLIQVDVNNYWQTNYSGVVKKNAD
ncbi:hypothetical protein ACQCT5_06225 [Sutcliffiella halmapala]